MKRLIFLLICLPILSNAQIISTFAGNGVPGYTGDGMAATASGLHTPYGVGIDSFGNTFIADAGDNRIRKIDHSGIISTIAGNGTAAYSGDGGPATAASLNFPIGMAVTRNGVVYIVDYWNHRLRKIDAEGAGMIYTICGTGTSGFSGDGGPATAAQIYRPQGIFIDKWNNIYFGDHYNHRVRKIDATGVITTVAGTGIGGYSGDGVAATASNLYYPSGVTVDSSGNVYIADYYNHRIRKVNTSGIISTVAGVGTPGYSGDGGLATSAQLRYPKDVTMDAVGNLYISDADNFVIRKVSPTGIITTIAGIATMGFSGDGGPTTAAQLNEPQGLFTDALGRIYIGDCNNNRIRVITPLSILQINSVDLPKTAEIFPNPAKDNIVVKIPGVQNGHVKLINEIGQTISEQNMKEGSATIDLSGLPGGLYFVMVEFQNGLYRQRFLKN